MFNLENVLVLKPGDTLIVNVKDGTAEEIEQLRNVTISQLPDLVDVVLFSVDNLVVYRP
jgi:hypothetical protein